MVATAIIPREYILAYFNEREEREIVVDRLAFDHYGAKIVIETLELEQERTAA